MIEIQAIIDKADIEPVGKMKGAVNSDTVTLSGQEYGPSALVFRGFAGAYDMTSGKWVGVYRFDPSVGGELDEMSIAELPGRSGDLQPVTETEINDDGI